jgi:hypothetical protein
MTRGLIVYSEGWRAGEIQLTPNREKRYERWHSGSPLVSFASRIQRRGRPAAVYIGVCPHDIFLTLRNCECVTVPKYWYATNIKDAVFRDVTPCGSYQNRCFGESYLLHHRDRKNTHSRISPVTSNFLIIFTLMMEAIISP